MRDSKLEAMLKELDEMEADIKARRNRDANWFLAVTSTLFVLTCVSSIVIERWF